MVSINNIILFCNYKFFTILSMAHLLKKTTAVTQLRSKNIICPTSVEV